MKGRNQHAKPSRGWQGDAALNTKFKKMIVRLAVWGLIPASFATWLVQRGGLNNGC